MKGWLFDIKYLFISKMKKGGFICCMLFFTPSIIAQDSIPKNTDDLKYREDQFYIGVTFNILVSNTNNLSPEGLSGGVNFGFIRDMPINKRRNLSFGVGAGVSLDQYGSNLLITKNENSQSEFIILNETLRYKYNRLQTAIIEAPIEFRWRSSTPTSYKFWRVHVGFRAGYTFWYSSRFNDYSNSFKNSDIPEYEKLRLGTTLSLGYNKFNFFAYYSLNQLFNDAYTVDGQLVDYKNLKLGLIFYIL